jgi:hypothetical protein
MELEFRRMYKAEIGKRVHRTIMGRTRRGRSRDALANAVVR